MFSKQSFTEAVLDPFLRTLLFDRGICMDVFVNLFEESDGAPAIFVTAKLAGAGVTNSSALCRKLHCHAIPNTSAANVFVVGSVKVTTNVFTCLSQSLLAW